MKSGRLAALLWCVTANASIEIPFRWTPGQIEIQVSVDGRAPLWFVLDSGAEFSMFDVTTAKELGIGRAARERLENVTWKIGALTMRGQTLVLWSLDNFRRQKREIRGVIGCELFERYVVAIDFQKHVIVLHEPREFRPSSTATALPITFDGRLPVVETKLKMGEKVLPSRLMVDTGAATAIVLRHPFATQHRLFSSESKTTTSETVAVGRRSFVKLSAQELILGRWTFPNPAIEAYGTPQGAGGYKTTDGLLGNDVLKRFRVTFDYSRKRILLEEAR